MAVEAGPKALRSKSDLAIHGAEPAFSEPLVVGRPNIGDRQGFRDYLDQILESGWLTNDGPFVKRLEARIAERMGVEHCVAMCNGTIALEVAIRALDLEGEVIVPSYTFAATAHALSWLGLTPVFADIDPSTHNLDPDSVKAKITDRTSGILAVHLWGRPAPHAALEVIAKEAEVPLLYDAAHAFDCTLDGQPIGRFGTCTVFSFHATKFFNTFEGGAVTTDDAALAERLRLMRNFGFQGYDDVASLGTNAKMTEPCAAMGLTNLDALPHVVDVNYRNYEAYRELVRDLPGVSILPFDESEAANYQYVVLEVGERCPIGRDRIIEALHAENVLARRYFWPGCHRMRPYRDRPGEDLPNTELVADRVIVMPTGTRVSVFDIERIAAIFRVLLS